MEYPSFIRCKSPLSVVKAFPIITNIYYPDTGWCSNDAVICSLVEDYHEDELILVSRRRSNWFGRLTFGKRGGARLIWKNYKFDFYLEDPEIKIWRIITVTDVNSILRGLSPPPPELENELT